MRLPVTQKKITTWFESSPPLASLRWRQEHCKEIIRGKGLEKITVDELVEEITPRGRATVPDDIKAELLQRIRKFLQST